MIRQESLKPSLWKMVVFLGLLAETSFVDSRTFFQHLLASMKL